MRLSLNGAGIGISVGHRGCIHWVDISEVFVVRGSSDPQHGEVYFASKCGRTYTMGVDERLDSVINQVRVLVPQGVTILERSSSPYRTIPVFWRSAIPCTVLLLLAVAIIWFRSSAVLGVMFLFLSLYEFFLRKVSRSGKYFPAFVIERYPAAYLFVGGLLVSMYLYLSYFE